MSFAMDPRLSRPSAAAPADARLLPISRPANIICVGANYVMHVNESAMEVPQQPLLFAKWSSSLIGPGEPIVVPLISSQVDFEAELGVVIATTASAVPEADALDVVAGYTCVNDVTARDLQVGDGQWTRGKSLDTFCPVGPALVPRDRIPDPQNLRIRCVVNGRVMQDDSTANMIFSVARLIAFISEAITLQPGDLIATGTPSGIGYARSPQQFLAAGDTVTVEIEGIGALTNPVVAQS